MTRIADSLRLRGMYKIIGSDQKEYGPVEAGYIEDWIAQGRANGQTIARFEDGAWKPLSTFPEFAAALAVAPISSVPPPTVAVSAAPERKANVMSISGFVLGILGLLQCCTPFIAILGLVFSAISFFQIRNEPDRYEGRNLAIAGMIISAVGILLFVILLKTGVIDELIKNLPKLETP